MNVKPLYQIYSIIPCYQHKMRYRTLKYEKSKRSASIQPVKHEMAEDPSQLIAVLEQCIAISQIKGSSFSKLVQFLRQNNYKYIQLHTLKEETCFNILKALDRWLVEIFTMARQQELPSHTVILSEFYRFAVKAFQTKKSDRMTTAYAYFLNNMALVSLRFKQYTKSLQYFDEIVGLYNVSRIQQSIFSVAHANLAILYKQLKQQEKSELNIVLATNITKDILNQYIIEDCSQKMIQEVGSLLAAQSALMSQILKPGDIRLVDSVNKIIELVKKGWVKPPQKKNWNLKSLVDKRVKGQFVTPVFQKLFKVNMEELKFYSEIGRSQTAQTHRKAPTNSLPPIQNGMTLYSKGKPAIEKSPKENSISIRKFSEFSPSTKITRTSSRFLIRQSEHLKQEIENSRYHESIFQQYSIIQEQNNSLRSSIQTLIQKQSDTERVLERFILPKIVEALSSPQRFFGNSLETLRAGENSIMFKNLRASIEFKYEGIIITSFSGVQEKMEWNALKYMMNRFQMLQLFQNELNLNSSQHEVAKVLFHYINVDRNIKIMRYPEPVYSLKLIPNTSLDFYHVRDELFKVAHLNSGRLEFIIYCQMCQKTFDRYFRAHKIDQFQENIQQRLQGDAPNKREFYLQAIKYKQGQELDLHLTSLAISMQNILAPFKEQLKNQEDETFVKLFLEVDEFQSENLLGSLYIVTPDNDIQKLVIDVYSLNGADNPMEAATALTKQHDYWKIMEDYGLNYFKLNKGQRILIQNLILDIYQLKIGRVRLTPHKHKKVMFVGVGTTQISCFVQKFIDQKYYRPAQVSLVGSEKKKHGLRFGLYNEYATFEDSFFVLFQVNRRPKNPLDAVNENEVKMQKMSKMIKRLDLKDIFMRYRKKKPEQREQIYHIESFIELYMWV